MRSLFLCRSNTVHSSSGIHESGFSFLATIRPALSYLEQAFDSASSFTLAVDLLLYGVKRRALQWRGPAKQATPLDSEDLAEVLLAVSPLVDTVG